MLFDGGGQFPILTLTSALADESVGADVRGCEIVAEDH